MHRVNKGILLIGLGLFIGFYTMVEVPSPVHVPASFPDYGAVFIKFGGYAVALICGLVGLYLAVSTPPRP
jgi:hypothetical protein